MKFSRNVENLIANLRGLPENRSRSRLRPELRIDSVVEVLLERHQIGQTKPAETIMAHWKELVGSTAAHRCAPLRIDERGNLFVAVANPVIKQELLFRKRQILARLQQLPGCEHLNDIVLRAG